MSKNRFLNIALGAALCLTFSAGSAFAQNTAAEPLPYGKLGAELVGLLAIAILLESGLATLFQWRLYREFFNGKAVKTIVMFAVGMLVVTQFNYDVFSRILALLGLPQSGNGTLSKLISALVLAGGSAGVFRLFSMFGLRVPIDQQIEQPKPPQNKAFISVRIVPADGAKNPKYNIHLEKVASPSPEDMKLGPVAGVVGAKSFSERLKGLFFADPMRFPGSGGRTVDAETPYVIRISWKAPSGNEDETIKTFDQEIFRGRFADRAIVDLVAKI